ncbi:MAG TPA: FAD/NAD(P)-binding protein [Thermodesulfobacteriota bacterium]|nr:FAD/NAD(P)-binding protein [Thermodesulfobacteriota bacterium]HNU71070.1 FAD/NAD(P)-binding protein [Thermodesulfobacteriota bacterium]
MLQPAKESLFLPGAAEIIKVEKLTETEKLFEFKFKNGQELGHAPGQFVEVSLFGYGEAPISVSSSPTKHGAFELAVRKVGNVTGALHRMEAGATVGIRGPFGRGFPVDEIKGKDVLFVGGGIGLVPLRSLINYVLDNRQDYGRVIIFFGARSPKERLFTAELEQWKNRKDAEFFETVDRGDDSWNGNVGVITTLFPKVDIDPKNMYAVIVGPPIMYRFAILEALSKGITEDKIIVSLERRMKCGLGKCGHCQIQHLYCCKDGPVFKYSEIKGIQEAI